MRHKYIIILSISLLLITSISLKAQRYVVSHVDDNLRLENIISLTLQKQGWVETARPSVDKPQALSVFKYQKADCENPLRITFLNFGDATSNALQSAIGSNILFIYDGKASSIFPVKKQFTHVMLKSIQNIFRLNDTHEMPIIALSNNNSELHCENKIVDSWAKIDAEFNK